MDDFHTISGRVIKGALPCPRCGCHAASLTMKFPSDQPGDLYPIVYVECCSMCAQGITVIDNLEHASIAAVASWNHYASGGETEAAD